jgi:hypothetical protein
MIGWAMESLKLSARRYWIEPVTLDADSNTAASSTAQSSHIIRSFIMKRFCLACLVALAPVVGAQSTDGPYKVLKAARVGGEGGWDYINADPVGRRLYIPRGGTPGMRATDSTPARAAGPGRIMVYNLDNLDSIGVVVDAGGQGAVVDPTSGHGFSSSRPGITMFDTKKLTVIKQRTI